MSILVIGEKPSVSRELAKVLGANTKKNGCLEGNGYVVSWCFGHLVGLQFPDEYSENWAAKWSFAQLPMIPEEWKFKISENSKDQFKVLKQLMNDRNIMEIICATDADREGECIFRYVYNLVKCQKPVKRLWISSLEASAIRDGFHKLKNSSAGDENVIHIRELQKKIKLLSVRTDNLRKLRAQNMIDNVVFNRELNDMKKQEDLYRMEMMQCSNAESQGAILLRETEKMMKLIDHSEMLTAFDEEQFTEYVDKIVITDRKTAVFYLKCGLKLKEELQCMATE